MPQHALAVRDLPIRERPFAKIPRHRKGLRFWDLGQPPGAIPLALGAVTLETEHVIAVGADPSAVLESGLPLLAGLTGAAGDLRVMGGGERHGDPPHASSPGGVT